MPFPAEHSARLKDPSGYERFRRENDKFAPGVHAIWGITSEDKAELQAIRFDAEKFTVEEAKAWLEKHEYKPILFEPASAKAEATADEFVMIEAASSNEGQSRFRVMGVAYSGGKMRLPGWRHPVVVDLSGLEIPEELPLLTNHENRTGSRVGIVSARVEDGCLVVEGEILSTSGQAKGIVEQARAGADWQLSIGAEIKDAELVRSRRTINGQVQTGPFYHIKQSVLREVSIVAVGADVATRMRIAARFNLYGGQTMDFGKWLQEHGINAAELNEEQKVKLKAAFENGEDPPELKPEQTKKSETKKVAASASPQETALQDKTDQTKTGESKTAETKAAEDPCSRQQAIQAVAQVREEAETAVRAERERVAAIQEVCAGEFAKIEQEAIRAGWTVEDTSQRVLKAMRQNRPQADVHLSVNHDRGRDYDTKTLEAALCLRAGISDETLVKAYGEQTLEAAWRERDVSLQQLFIECARLEGITVPRTFCNDTIRAAFSTVSLPGILNNVADKKLLKSFQAQPVLATKLCSEGELNDFKESERYRLTDVGDLEPIAPDGELKHGGLTEEKATNQLGTFGKIFALTRQMIYNDDLGAFLKVPEGMGARAARKIDQLFFTRLLSNPNSLFSVANKNYNAGADTALSPDSLVEAVQMFLDQIDADGQPINVSPKFLLVPTALKMTARELLNSTFYFATGSSDKQRIPTYNALADEDLEVVSSPYLSNANYTGASSKAWYLFADPSIVDTFEIGYLKGRRTPTVEKGDTDFDTLGVKFRVYFDLGVREQDHRGMVKFKGES